MQIDTKYDGYLCPECGMNGLSFWAGVWVGRGDDGDTLKVRLLIDIKCSCCHFHPVENEVAD